MTVTEVAAESDALDWSSLLSAVIGGLLALLGVFLTQIFERKKAHADRVWDQRAQIYSLLYRWAEVATTQVLDARTKLTEPNVTLLSQLQDSPYFGADNIAVLAVFGSDDVNKEYREAEAARVESVSAFNKWKTLESGQVERKDVVAELANKATVAISRVKQRIESETRRGK